MNRPNRLTSMTRTLLYAVAALLCASGAVASEWQMDPDNSRLMFTAQQQDADFQGEFQNFSATISFDPASPEATLINAVIQLESVATWNAERDEILAAPEWFDLLNWPESTYTASSARATDAGWIADGELTLKGITVPVELAFRFAEDGDGARFTGSAKIKRLDFKVGTGDWTDTRWVGNEVGIEVDLRLIPAPHAKGPQQN